MPAGHILTEEEISAAKKAGFAEDTQEAFRLAVQAREKKWKEALNEGWVLPKKVGKCRLQDLSQDLLSEILGWCHPVDVLHLARTAKSFRKFLMSRRSKPIWTRALSSVEGLPSVPDYIYCDEPRFVALMFTEECHECEIWKTDPVAVEEGIFPILHMDAYTRLCHWCTEFLFDVWDGEMFPEGLEAEECEFMIPRTTEPLRLDEREEAKRLGRDSDDLAIPARYHIASAETFQELYDAVLKDEDIPQFLQDEEEIWIQRKKHAQLCLEFLEEQK
ncbi:hypothetical protein DFP72DRAFT_868508, partial [Ephemerocybe angulata]